MIIRTVRTVALLVSQDAAGQRRDCSRPPGLYIETACAVSAGDSELGQASRTNRWTSSHVLLTRVFGDTRIWNLHRM